MKKLIKVAKEINELLLKDPLINEYLKLKEEIEEDTQLMELKGRLDLLRKEICKDKEKDSDEYYNLLDVYKQDKRIRRYEVLQKEINGFFSDISDILSLK